MDTLKKFAMYILFIIGFYIFSNILIFCGINSTYKNIFAESSLPSQVEISQAQATLVNGRIKGSVQNNSDNNLNGKYLKFNLYSERDNLLGVKYLDIANLGSDSSANFEIYFKVQDVKKYSIEIVDEKEVVNTELAVFIDEDMKTYMILGALLFLIIA